MTALATTAPRERFPIGLTMKPNGLWPESSLDSTLVASPFGKPVTAFPGNVLQPFPAELNRI
jgi:hypothetical protein